MLPNPKNLLIGSLLSALVGGGGYGLYVKYFSPAAYQQISAIELSNQCADFLAYPNLITTREKEISAFFEVVAKQYPDISKSDVLVTTASSTGGGKEVTGMGAALRECTKNLKTEYEMAKKRPSHR